VGKQRCSTGTEIPYDKGSIGCTEVREEVIMLDKAMKEIKKRKHDLHEMIEHADEMIPKKKGGPLDASDVWNKKAGKIIGEGEEVMPNKLLNRFKEITRKK
jgi:hypothetical protein